MNLQVTDVPLPVRLLYQTPLTDEELLRFSEGNEVVWIEREPDGSLYIKPILATKEGFISGAINCDLGQWADADGRGTPLGRTGYLLPDGSMRGAPISWVLKERLAQLKQEGRDGYPRLAPDFIVEIRSVFDDPAYLLRKMDQWIANGVQVAWLVDPDEESVTIYRPGDQPEHLAHPTSVQGTGPTAGFELLMDRIWN
jgi:Uma2 family endonuclease